MKIYTFYEPIAGVTNGAEICSVWAENWRLFGWEPVVLGMADARRHKRFAAVVAAVRNLPTVNNIVYETINYIRHLALPQPEGLLVDFDMLSNGFTPKMFHALKRPYIPGFMVGGAGFCGNVDWLMSRLLEWPKGLRQIMFVDGKPHFSDQYLKEFLGTVIYYEACRFNDPEFWLQPVWHFTNDSLIARGYHPSDRYLVMRSHAQVIARRQSLWTRSQ